MRREFGTAVVSEPEEHVEARRSSYFRLARLASEITSSAALRPSPVHCHRRSQHTASGSRSECSAAIHGVPTVLRVVLTGGPCGGKTTALPSIAEALRKRGIPTVTVPETATSLVEAGIDRVAMIGTPEGLFEFNLQIKT